MHAYVTRSVGLLHASEDGINARGPRGEKAEKTKNSPPLGLSFPVEVARREHTAGNARGQAPASSDSSRLRATYRLQAADGPHCWAWSSAYHKSHSCCTSGSSRHCQLGARTSQTLSRWPHGPTPAKYRVPSTTKARSPPTNTCGRSCLVAAASPAAGCARSATHHTHHSAMRALTHMTRSLPASSSLTSAAVCGALATYPRTRAWDKRHPCVAGQFGRAGQVDRHRLVRPVRRVGAARRLVP